MHVRGWSLSVHLSWVWNIQPCFPCATSFPPVPPGSPAPPSVVAPPCLAARRSAIARMPLARSTCVYVLVHTSIRKWCATISTSLTGAQWLFHNPVQIILMISALLYFMPHICRHLRLSWSWCPCFRWCLELLLILGTRDGSSVQRKAAKITISFTTNSYLNYCLFIPIGRLKKNNVHTYRITH